MRIKSPSAGTCNSDDVDISIKLDLASIIRSEAPYPATVITVKSIVDPGTTYAFSGEELEAMYRALHGAQEGEILAPLTVIMHMQNLESQNVRMASLLIAHHPCEKCNAVGFLLTPVNPENLPQGEVETNLFQPVPCPKCHGLRFDVPVRN